MNKEQLTKFIERLENEQRCGNPCIRLNNISIWFDGYEYVDDKWDEFKKVLFFKDDVISSIVYIEDIKKVEYMVRDKILFRIIYEDKGGENNA